VLLVWRLVPESPVRTPSRLDWRGALTLSAGLSALLLALTEGERWGWLSATTLGVAAAAVALLCLWVWVELRVPMFLLAGLVALVGAVAVLRIPRRGAEVEAEGEAEAEPALA
jgi:uncharacterized membrane protein YeaQ/YmgE (transglycosylase-associated protein family)